jgi:outer membrane protein assembly factor BamC
MRTELRRGDQRIAPRRIAALVALAAAAVLATGCQSVGGLFKSEKIDYRTAGRLPPLEVPPDLTRPGRDNRYQVPDGPQGGSATFSAYNAERSGRPTGAAAEVLPNVEKVRLQRAGSERWLVVPESPDKLWPVVKEFWQENGFLLRVEMPDVGVMETDWAENRARIPQDPIRNVLGKVLDSAYSSGERDKFRTRLERGAEPNSSEIYISHRGMVEVITTTTQGRGGYDGTVWQPRAPDPELEAEFLRRLMVRLGVEDTRAKSMVVQDRVTTERARLGKSSSGTGTLDLAEPFDRAWRRVGLALDRVGFTVEDRDRTNGYYFVRYVDPAQDNAKSDGLLSKLAFWRSNEKPAPTAQYRVVVREQNADATRIEVMNKDGAPESSATSSRILSLLYDQLK